MVATVEQLAELVHGRLVGDGSVSIRSARPVAEAGPGDITFIENDRFAKLLRACGPDEKRNVAARLCETRPKVAADGTSTNNQNLHGVSSRLFKLDGFDALAYLDGILQPDRRSGRCEL